MIKTFLNSLFFIVIVLTFPARGEKNEWIITKSSGGDELLMQLSDTKGVTKRKIIIELNNGIEPHAVKIEYENGFSNSATPGQIKYFWIERNAQKSVWNYLKSKGKIETINTSDLSAIPDYLYGKLVMCIDKRGKEFIGRIEGIKANQKWFALDIKHAQKPVSFYIPGIEEIWYLK